MTIRTKMSLPFTREPNFYEKISNEFCFPVQGFPYENGAEKANLIWMKVCNCHD